MRHSWITLVAGAVFSAAPATLAAQATTTVERDVEFVQSFSDYNPCNNEPIAVTGTFTTTIRTTVDATGRSHAATSVLGKLDGVGASGAKYHIQFPSNLVDIRDEGGQLLHRNYTETIHYISQGKAPNFLSTYVFHWIIAPDGTTKLEVEHLDEKCEGGG